MPAAKRSRIFTHKEVNALKCKEGKPYTDIAEGGGRDGGFGIRVYATGRKVFFYKFYLERKLKYMSLGDLPVGDQGKNTETQTPRLCRCP